MSSSPDTYWGYYPTKGVPTAFAVLFTISAVHHTWENVLKRKTYRIGFLFPWAALLFVAGLSLREYGAFHPDNLKVLIASTVFMYSGPPAYAAMDYLIIGRALYYVPYLSPLHPGRIMTTFLGLDAIIETIACNGIARFANQKNTPAQREIGIKLVKASLILLIIAFLLFLLVIIIFHRRCKRAGIFNHKLKIIIYTQYASCALILTRNLIRTIGAFVALDNPIQKEPIFYTLEVLPMLSNTVMMNFLPPTKYLPVDHTVYLATDGKTELEGPGWADKRNFLVTLFDPMDLFGLIRGKDNKDRFWEEDGIGGPKKQTEVTTVQV